MPTPTANAKTKPTGTGIDSQANSLSETGEKFCTAKIAIAPVHAATINAVKNTERERIKSLLTYCLGDFYEHILAVAVSEAYRLEISLVIALSMIAIPVAVGHRAEVRQKAYLSSAPQRHCCYPGSRH
jgi:Na+/serine symporter